MMPLPRIEPAGAEDDGEDGEARRHPECHARQFTRIRTGRGEDSEGQRHGLKLQRDIGRGADHREHRDQNGDQVRLAVAAGDDVGDGGHALRPADAHELSQEPPPADEDDGGPKVDRHEFETGARGIADRAVERPSGAVDRQRQRVDDRPPQKTARPARGPPFAREGHGEQEYHISKAGRDQQVEGERHSAPSPPPAVVSMRAARRAMCRASPISTAQTAKR
ncbi:hypothetical protein JSE7799_01273 [Jannaschia seosinensis]|uniref:Uncharacterized protein n=1 Tax=Jannaschia seosinensis TaxID=313367 RepID=A0A0M7B922_9RHOB|nr:hypothetical protein JSE7799_01273 [Jannaschia seosinensis]